MASSSGKRIAVYSAVVGDYDHLTGQNEFAEGVDYLFYTDSKSAPPGWQHRQLQDMPHLDRRRQAKIPKVYPWHFEELRGYDYTIWIDGSMNIAKANFYEDMLRWESFRSGMIISPHFDGRHCAYGEATIRPMKYAKEPLDAQVEHYRSEGFPEQYGLYECGLMARSMHNAEVQDVCREWLFQNLLFSYQDQVSLPYVFWKHDFKPDVLPKSFRDFGWVHINAHKSEK